MKNNRVFGMMRNVRNFPAYLFHKWGIARQDPFILKAHNSVTVEVPERMMHTAKEVFFKDDYQFDQIQKEVISLSSSPVIVDVGANVGYLSAFSFARFPTAKVVSVEPIPKNIALLKRNRERNPHFDWVIVEGVLANADLEVEIQFDSADSFSTSASLYGLDSGKDVLRVKGQTLISLMKEQQLDRLHILKLDCEGAEYDILYCLHAEELTRIAFITMETHQIDDQRRNRDALVTWLNEKGWKTEVVRSKVLARNCNFKK